MERSTSWKEGDDLIETFGVKIGQVKKILVKKNSKPHQLIRFYLNSGNIIPAGIIPLTAIKKHGRTKESNRN